MASEQDHYAILQVHPDAEPEVITAAYRSLARLYHPDTNRSPDAVRRMAQINVAYEVLSDPARRAAYDQSRQATRSQQVPRAQSGNRPRRPPQHAEEGYDWTNVPGATTVTVRSASAGWGGCCGCVVLIVIIVVAISMCGAAVGLT